MAENCIDGVKARRDLFSTDDALVEHIIEHTLFFDKKIVLKQAREICGQISTGKAIPFRFTSNKN